MTALGRDTGSLSAMANSPVPPTGRLIGVGVGPGDPEYLTRQAMRVLGESPRIVAPTTAVDAVGRAEAVVREACPGLVARIERLVFDMVPDDAAAGTSSRAASHRRAAERLVPWLDAGEQVAFVTLGDPSIYSTFSSLTSAVRELRPGIEIGCVPGIMAFQALAARTGTPLVDGKESLRLLTALEGADEVASALEVERSAVVVYKGGRHLPSIAKALAEAGRLDGSWMGELLGLPGERIVPVADAACGPATYLATVIIPPAVVPGRGPGTAPAVPPAGGPAAGEAG
jgi:precorrin-2/cobalt-factor-2 C20-methyltransferase